jgi:rhodanese-related sulfurtransferase
MLLIWDFRVEQELSEKATPQQPHLPSAEILPIAPLLDIEKVRKAHGCNCSTFPLANDVFVNLQSGEESQVDGKILYFIRLEKEHFLVGLLLLWSQNTLSCLKFMYSFCICTL